MSDNVSRKNGYVKRLGNMDGEKNSERPYTVAMDGHVYSSEIVGERIDRLRKVLDLGSQADLARMLGVSSTRMNNWVMGENLLPVAYAYKLKQLTGVTLDYLYCGDASSLPVKLAISLAHDGSPGGGA